MLLKKNDVVGIVAPAGFIKNQESINQAITLLKNWGLQVKLGKHLFKKHNHFAGTDAERLEDFQNFLDDPKINAIWCARGGYGSVRIIDKLDFSSFKKNPKFIIGYSDITLFLTTVYNLNIPSIHSFMPTSLDTILHHKEAVLTFKNILFGNSVSYVIKQNKNNKKGIAKGKIIGGNLSILQSICGTPYSINKEKYLLFIEEIGEYKYHIDRMLHTLKLNGVLKNCSGLIVGNFTNIKKNDPLFGETIEEIILNTTKEYSFPICFDFPAGHIGNNNPIIFGKDAILQVGETISLKYIDN